MFAGAGDPDVQQPAFLVHRLPGLSANEIGIEALAEPDQEHGVPFQALGGVQRGEGDALDGRGVLGQGAFLELVDEVRERELRRRG